MKSKPKCAGKGAPAKRHNRSGWLALGAAGMVACGVGGPMAGTAVAAARQTAKVTADPETFDNAPGLLSDVLDAFQYAAGVRVKPTNGEFDSLKSAGVRGRFAPTSALAQILEGL
jgi:hypothetical protein